MAYENEIGNMETAFNTGNVVDEHKYEQLQRPRPTRERMEMEASDGHNRKCCRMPPWWGWLLIVIGLLILCAVIVSMAVFLTSKCSSLIDGHECHCEISVFNGVLHVVKRFIIRLRTYICFRSIVNMTTFDSSKWLW